MWKKNEIKAEIRTQIILYQRVAYIFFEKILDDCERE